MPLGRDGAAALGAQQAGELAGGVALDDDDPLGPLEVREQRRRQRVELHTVEIAGVFRPQPLQGLDDRRSGGAPADDQPAELRRPVQPRRQGQVLAEQAQLGEPLVDHGGAHREILGDAAIGVVLVAVHAHEPLAPAGNAAGRDAVRAGRVALVVGRGGLDPRLGRRFRQGQGGQILHTVEQVLIGEHEHR